jgi:uncharacterized repeat protein (TIGR03803 family)
MRSIENRIAMFVLFSASLLATGPRAAAQHEGVLFSFPGSQKSANGPIAGVIFDASGNLYGTTTGDGNGFGTVFELTPAAGGRWTEETLYSFGISGSGDGNFPVAGLVSDAAGNLYGTTEDGGSACNPPGCGVVFELTPSPQAGWTEKVLYSFHANGTDGNSPQSGLVLDAKGNLYGTTVLGGTSNLGTVYELTPAADGNWKEKMLHSFDENRDGRNPSASLIFDASGNLYGTTSGNGVFPYGTVFELTPTAGGKWKEKILQSFGKSNGGGFVMSGVIFDPAGNLYGTTANGGDQDVGTVFELSPQAGEDWTAKILYSFNRGGADGQSPATGVIMDSAGNLYGSTQGGGPHNDGIVFKLSPAARGAWAEEILHNFNFTDGFFPDAPLIIDASGHLYGTTLLGGANGGGEVFEIIP